MPWDVEEAESGLAEIWSLDRAAVRKTLDDNFRRLVSTRTG
jgi:hypothetical protein